MLEYFNQGDRRYADGPVLPYPRSRWEFQAVVSGRLSPWIDAEPHPPVSRRLWVFPPGLAHGWTNPPGQVCRIVVMHFSDVPPEMVRATAELPWLETPLTPAQARRIEQLGEMVEPYVGSGHAIAPLVFQQAVIELTVMALRDLAARWRSESALTPAQRKVRQAIAWYEEHLPDGPGVEEAARAVNVSAVHLRRLFLQSGRGNPHAVFMELRLNRAETLLRDTDWKLAAVAGAAGFSGPESFLRAYRQGRGTTPGKYRAKHRDAAAAAEDFAITRQAGSR